MGYKMQCCNKGCCNMMEPYIDLQSNKVYCSLCDKEILNVSNIALNQMKLFKQVKKSVPKPFSVKCKKCKAFEPPIIKEKDKAFCSSCSEEMDNVSVAFINVLKLNGNF